MFVIAKQQKAAAGMTLIELIIVVALLAGVMVYALPNIMLNKEAEIQTKLSRLREDIQSAFDMAVLSGKNYRLVFSLDTQEYWLEVGSEEGMINLDPLRLGRDLTDAEEKKEVERFEIEFKDKYESLADEAVKDPETDKEIKPTSPVIQAKNLLSPKEWKPVENLEWSIRNLGSALVFKDIQAEHHTQRQSADSMNVESPRAIVYVYPRGYIERAVIRVAYSSDEENTEEQLPYLLVIEPHTGSTRMLVAGDEYDLNKAAQDEAE